MKVVVVDPWHFTPPYDRELCRGLSRIGHHVAFVSSDRCETAPDMADDERSSVKALPLFSTPATWLPRSFELITKGLQHIRGMARLYSQLRAQKPDVIHFQWLSLPLVDAFFLALFRRIAPVVLTVHDSNPYNGAGPWLLRAGNAIAMHRCDHFIVHNKVSEQRLKEQGLAADRIHKIAHGLLDHIAADNDPKPVRKDRRVHFLQFGKLKEYKGADILLTALASLNPETRQECRVSIVGRPYIDVQPLIDLVDENGLEDVADLRFDFISDDEMVALFDETDFLVFPYREIDTSGVLMVAVARGIPVVASNIGCFAEMLTDGDEGVLVPPGDPKMLADAMAALISEPERRAIMAEKMESMRERVPSWDAIAKATTIVYERAQLEPISQPVRAHT